MCPGQQGAGSSFMGSGMVWYGMVWMCPGQQGAGNSFMGSALFLLSQVGQEGFTPGSRKRKELCSTKQQTKHWKTWDVLDGKKLAMLQKLYSVTV